jgi:hypothetical protein
VNFEAEQTHVQQTDSVTDVFEVRQSCRAGFARNPHDIYFASLRAVSQDPRSKVHLTCTILGSRFKDYVWNDHGDSAGACIELFLKRHGFYSGSSVQISRLKAPNPAAGKTAINQASRINALCKTRPVPRSAVHGTLSRIPGWSRRADSNTNKVRKRLF